MFNGQFADGEALSGSGSAIVYTGYEWRGTLKIGDESYRQVMAASADGAELTGRMFQRDHDEWGLRMRLCGDAPERAAGGATGFIAAGGESLPTLVGINLDGAADLRPGLKVLEEVSGAPARSCCGWRQMTPPRWVCERFGLENPTCRMPSPCTRVWIDCRWSPRSR